MRILLIDPPGKNKGLNTGLGYISALLNEKYDVRVLDLNNIEVGFCGDSNPDMPKKDLEKRIISVIDDFDPHIFGVSVKSFTAEISKLIFSFIDERKHNMITIAGGPHITLDGYKYIKENKIDFGIQGEGEYATLKLCDALEKNLGMENIDGIIYWQGNHVRQNPKKKTLANLDSLPFPFYDVFSSVKDNQGYFKEYPLLTSRGCPYRCTYCSMPQIMGNKWRSHSPSRVIKELLHAKTKYHCTSFTVVDDNFTLDLKRIEEICDLLILEKVNLSWNSQNGIRADRVSKGLAEKMKRSGCQFVWIGIESADEKVFRSINKGVELKNIETGIRHLKKAGIHVGGFFIVGLPHSTRETDLKSVEYAKKLGIEGWWFNFVPYPCTEAWKWVQTNGKILRPIEGALQYGSHDIEPVFETDDYPKNIRMKTYDEIHINGRYFDRLIDQSLKQKGKWLLVYKKVRPYGITTIILFLIYLLKYSAKSAKSKILNKKFKFLG